MVRNVFQSGGVTAFKFRDPEGHPLELLSFRRNDTPLKWRVAQGGAPCLGIDQSAISVSDTAASVGFYEALGLSVSTNSRNVGPEQDALDGLAHVTVDVAGLAPPSPAPHVELLSYPGETPAPPEALRANDIAATQLVFESADTSAPFGLTDPDGHHLMIFPNSNSPRAG
jgi:catechol 2,3-dioxygenase-like lactoylglutathione lyase family enzyme